MRWLLIATLIAAFAAMTAAMATADPNPAFVPPHRHFVQNPDGSLSEVGPRVCDNPSPGVMKAFLQFHANIHNASAGNNGPAAPGLHNEKGAELKVFFMLGCGQPQEQ